MTIIGIAGAIGSGKSFTQLKHGLKYVEDRQKQLVTNFPINVEQLRKYASYPVEYQSLFFHFLYELKKLIYAFRFSFNVLLPKIFARPKKPKLTPQLPWIKRLCETGGIIQIPSPEKIEALLIPESVVLLDEAGVLLNSREFAKTSKQLLADLAQSRKDGCDLIWCAQFEEQVDRQLRFLTQFWIHCDSISVYEKKLRRPSLKFKRIYWFRASDYMDWLRNPRARGSHFKTKFVFSTMYEGGFLTKADRQLFKIYDSFKRLDKEYDGARIVSMFQCVLPSGYFLRLKSSEEYPGSPKLLPYAYHYNQAKLSQSIASMQKADSISSETDSIASMQKPKKFYIKKGLQIARDKGINPPYFSDMTISEIESFLSRYE